MNEAYKKEKLELLREEDEFDKRTETRLPSQQKLDLKQSVKERLA